jgi:hypothetical protein
LRKEHSQFPCHPPHCYDNCCLKFPSPQQHQLLSPQSALLVFCYYSLPVQMGLIIISSCCINPKPQAPNPAAACKPWTWKPADQQSELIEQQQNQTAQIEFISF